MNRQQSWNGIRLGLLGVAGILACSGCGMNRRYANDSIRQLRHQDVAIRYRVDATAAPLAASTRPSGDAATGDVRTAGFDDADGELPADPSGTRRELEVVYPHPAPRYGTNYAQVTLRSFPPDAETAGGLGSRIRQIAFRSEETESHPTVCYLALPYDEFELLMRDLVADGLFDRGKRVSRGVSVDVKLGSRSIEKAWDRIPALEKLAVRAELARSRTAGMRRGSGGVQPASHDAPADGFKKTPAPAEPAGPLQLRTPPAGAATGPPATVGLLPPDTAVPAAPSADPPARPASDEVEFVPAPDRMRGE